MNPATWFEENLALVNQIIDGVCRRARIFGADAEDFASSTRIALMSDDYAILRKHEGRSSLPTYLNIVIQRLMLDERMKTHGRWHPSAEAVRMGNVAVTLERLLRWEQRTLAEATPVVRALHPEVSVDEINAMVARLPDRMPRPRAVELDEATYDTVASPDRADAALDAAESRQLSRRASTVIRETIATWSAEDRMLVRFRFASAMKIADISRMLRLPQRPLYRRIEGLLDRLRRALVDSGIDASQVNEILQTASDELQFGLDPEGDASEKTNPCQSIRDEATSVAEQPP